MTISVAEGLKALQSTNLWETFDIKENGRFGDQEFIELKQGDFVLAKTYEKITVPRNMIARVEGRSTYARSASVCIKPRHGFSLVGKDKSYWSS